MSDMSEPLRRFSKAMQIVLRQNAHKGDGIDSYHGIERLWQELRELDREAWGHPNRTTSIEKFEAIKKECVDIANFAMMVWIDLEAHKEDSIAGRRFPREQ